MSQKFILSGKTSFACDVWKCCSIWKDTCRWVLWFGCGRQKKRHAAAPPPAGVWRRMERNRQKPVSRDKGSLAEQQTRGTATTMIQIRRKHNTNCTTQRAALLDQTVAATLPSRDWVPPIPLPATGTQRDGTWYGIPCSVWPDWGQPTRLCPFLDSSEN